jgi:predicted PurR-regulated permease PerM
MLLLVLALGGPILGSYQAVANFDWKDFANETKVDNIKDALASIGIDNRTWNVGKVIADHEGQVMSVASATIDLASSIVLTLLLFVFSLAATLPGIHMRKPRSPVRDLMRQYLVYKALATFIITFAVVATLGIMGVPLLPVCGILTFVLNFIPNVGSFLAILAPLPLVYLKKGSTNGDVILAGLVPFLIHNMFGCLLEPQLMGRGLDLHPLTVVVSLTFWGCVWGIPGAVLSVPITCALKLALEGVDHPEWVKELRVRIDDPMGHGSSQDGSSVRRGSEVHSGVEAGGESQMALPLHSVSPPQRSA